MKHAVIADQAQGPNCAGENNRSIGYNVDSDGSCSLKSDTDLSGVDPLLGPLQDNGGPTLTHALLPGSPGINAIPLADCTVPDDQRGVWRDVVRNTD